MDETLEHFDAELVAAVRRAIADIRAAGEEPSGNQVAARVRGRRQTVIRICKLLLGVEAGQFTELSHEGKVDAELADLARDQEATAQSLRRLQARIQQYVAQRVPEGQIVRLQEERGRVMLKEERLQMRVDAVEATRDEAQRADARQALADATAGYADSKVALDALCQQYRTHIDALATLEQVYRDIILTVADMRLARETAEDAAKVAGVAQPDLPLVECPWPPLFPDLWTMRGGGAVLLWRQITILQGWLRGDPPERSVVLALPGDTTPVAAKRARLDDMCADYTALVANQVSPDGPVAESVDENELTQTLEEPF